MKKKQDKNRQTLFAFPFFVLQHNALFNETDNCVEMTGDRRRTSEGDLFDTRTDGHHRNGKERNRPSSTNSFDTDR